MSRKDKKQAKAAAGDGTPKKSRRKGCLIVVLVILVIGVIGAIAGGGSNGGSSSSDTSSESAATQDEGSTSSDDTEAQESTPTSRITQNTTDVDAAVVSVDETGVTLTLTSDDHDNTLVVPNYYKIGDETYNILGSDGELNPQVHFSQNGEDISTATLDIKAGTSQDVHMSVDGVTDYSQFEVNLDDVLYENAGKSWHMKDLVIAVTTE